MMFAAAPACSQGRAVAWTLWIGGVSALVGLVGPATGNTSLYFFSTAGYSVGYMPADRGHPPLPSRARVFLPARACAALVVNAPVTRLDPTLSEVFPARSGGADGGRVRVIPAFFVLACLSNWVYRLVVLGIMGRDTLASFVPGTFGPPWPPCW